LANKKIARNPANWAKSLAGPSQWYIYICPDEQSLG